MPDRSRSISLIDEAGGPCLPLRFRHSAEAASAAVSAVDATHVHVREACAGWSPTPWHWRGRVEGATPAGRTPGTSDHGGVVFVLTRLSRRWPSLQLERMTLQSACRRGASANWAVSPTSSGRSFGRSWRAGYKLLP